MKKVIKSIFIFSLVFILVACNNSTASSKKKNKEATVETYNNEVVDPTYLKTKLSEATSIYYKSNDEGKFGDDKQVFRHSIMPEGYTELEYLESNGSQYIDTGVEYKNTLQVEITFKDYTSAVRTGGLFGSGSYLFSIYKNTDSQLIFFNKEATYFTMNNFSSKRKYTIKANANMVNMSGTNGTLHNNSGSHQAYGNMTIFKSYSGYASYKLYSFILKDGDTTIRNYVPARRDLDNELGLYDLVNGVFYTNNSESKFVTKRELPSGYTQVEYIESDGYNYIDSGLTVSKADEAIYDADIQMLSTETKWAGANCYLEYQYNYIQTLDKVNMKLHWYPDDELEKVYIDGHFKSERDWSAYNINNVKIGIFRLGNSSNTWWGTPEQSQKARLYGLKITINDVLLRDYVPAYRNSDNEVGLYDMVNGVFYQSEFQSQNFISGNIVRQVDVGEEYTQLEYIESTGSQQIDTGLKLDMEHDSVEIAFESTTTNQNGMIVASKTGNKHFWFYNYAEGDHFGLYINNNGQVAVGNKNLDTYYHVMKYEDKSLYLDDKLLGSDSRSLGITDYNIFLFSWGGSYFYQGRIYGCKITQNGVLTRDYIPVERKSDGALGLLDIVNNAFYTDPDLDENNNFVKGREVTSNAVPSNYKELGFIEFSGKQYIDSGITSLTAPFKVEITYSRSNNDRDSDQTLFGQRQLGKFPNIYGGYYETAYGNTEYETEYGDGKIHTVITDSELGFYKDGNALISGTLDDAASSYPALIGAFSESSPDEAKWFFKGRIYNIKITNNGVLYRNYIPVIRTSDNVIGLYDVVNNSFYQNSYKFQLIAGSEVFGNSNYRQIEYLSISKGDTIDTGVFGGAIYDFDIEWKGDGTRQLMGYSTRSAEYFGVQEDGSYGIGWWNKTTYMAGNRDKLKWVFEENNAENGVYVDGTRIVYSGYTDVSEKEFTIGNISKDTSFPCAFKLYGLKVTQNNTLIRNFVPVYSVSEEKNGLYDLVNDVFYPSGSKMTEFIPGEDLEYYDEGTVVREASYKDEGEIVYHSLVSDKELHKIIKPYSYKVTIESDTGVKDISVCDGYDLSKCSKTNIAYTRNLNTNNYSTNGTFIMIKIELENGYELVDSEGMLENYDNHEGIYMIKNIHSNISIQIRTRN